MPEEKGQPITRADLDHAVESITTTVTAAIQASEERTREEIKAAEQRSREFAAEVARDMQTEILRGLEGFARGNFTRLHRLETSDNDLHISALEERVLYLETRRQNPPPPPPQ